MANPSPLKPGLAAVYLNRRMAVLLGLGFASGLPSQVTGGTLSSWLSMAGVDVATIGLLGLVALPYSLKFLVAPLMDRYVPPGLGRRRGWLLITQVLLVAGIAAMAFAGPSPEAEDGRSVMLLAGLAVAVAVCSACQDVVGDAYRTDVLSRSELGAGVAVWVTAYRVAMLVAASGALALSSVIGWRAVYLLLAGLMGIGVVATLLAPEPSGAAARPGSLREAVVDPFRAFLQQHGRAAGLTLAVVLLFRLPDDLARAMTDPLLLQHLAFDAGLVALAKGWAIGLTIAGAVVGGGIVARLGVVRSLWVFGVLQAVSNGGFWLLSGTGGASGGGGTGLMFAVMAVESLCGGLVTAGFLAFLMSLCDRRYSAFQFALLTSLMALARPVLSAPTGYLVEALGYGGFFAVTILAGLPALLLLRRLREPGVEEEELPGLAEVMAE